MEKKTKIIIVGLIVVIILVSAIFYIALMNQKCINCQEGTSEFCIGETLADCNGKKVSIIGVINSVPVGKFYGYDMADGVEWNGKLLSNVIVDFTNITKLVPLDKKIQINGTVRAIHYIVEDDGLQHLVDSEGRLYDPTVIVAEEIRELSEDEIHFDFIFGEELKDKIGEQIKINGTFWTAKGFDFIAINGNHSNDTRLFFDNETLSKRNPKYQETNPKQI